MVKAIGRIENSGPQKSYLPAGTLPTMLRVGFITLFPDVIRAAMEESILKRATVAELVRFDYANPRDFSTDKHKTVDDSPYGGEPGMLMKAETVAKAIESLSPSPEAIFIMPEPASPAFQQTDANELAEAQEIIFICGHYEGIDARIAQFYKARAYSVGEFVVTGGELPAAMMADSIVRRLPGALGNAKSLDADSYSDGLLSAPNYTRPEEWRGLKVPDVLVSGHHAEIAKWRRQQAILATHALRPDLLEKVELTAKERKWLEQTLSSDGLNTEST